MNYSSHDTSRCLIVVVQSQPFYRDMYTNASFLRCYSGV